MDRIADPPEFREGGGMTTTVSMSGVMPVLWRRKRLLLVSGFLTAGIFFSVSRVLPLQYASEGSLMIDNRPTGGSDSSSSQTVLTEVDVLQSKGLIRQSVIDYNLTEVADLAPRYRLPDAVKTPLVALRNEVFDLWRSINKNAQSTSEVDQVTDYIQKHLKVVAKEKSFVISVQFSGGSAETASVVANAIIKTYLKAVEGAKQDRVQTADKLIAEQTALHQKEVVTAETRVTQYVQSHKLPEVQGSLTTAIQLSEDQKALNKAREELAQKEAALSAASRGGISATTQTLESKTIQALKDAESKLVVTLSAMGDNDPRRGPLEIQLGSVRSRIGGESKSISTSLAHDVDIARARVASLEKSIQQESTVAQDTSVSGATLRQLTDDLDAKRKLYVSFLTDAGQARIAAANAPTAHNLFQALPPERPANAMGILSLMIGMICGGTGAAAWAVLRAMMSPKINSADDMTVMTGLRTFGSLPNVKARNLAAPPKQTPLVTETLRHMWVTLRSPQIAGTVTAGTVIAVTSSDTKEGKTTVAMAIAQRFTDDGARVLLIDADLRNPRLSKTVGKLLHQYSVESVLLGEATWEQAVVTVKDGLDCMLSTGRHNNPVRLLSSHAFEQLLGTVRDRYDFVIVDTPPVLHVTDPIVVAKHCQRIIFIVRAGSMRADLVEEAIARFPEDERHKIMPLLIRVPRAELTMRDYYAGYHR